MLAETLFPRSHTLGLPPAVSAGFDGRIRTLRLCLLGSRGSRCHDRLDDDEVQKQAVSTCACMHTLCKEPSSYSDSKTES
jgi:hypothetical protein